MLSYKENFKKRKMPDWSRKGRSKFFEMGSKRYLVCLQCTYLFTHRLYSCQTKLHHTEELQKLKTAKAEAEAKHVDVEKSLRSELDSLRTSYRFKACKYPHSHTKIDARLPIVEPQSRGRGPANPIHSQSKENRQTIPVHSRCTFESTAYQARTCSGPKHFLPESSE